MKSATLVLVLASAASAAVSIDLVPVVGPPNAPDSRLMNDGTSGYGSVGYVYSIGKYEVTNAQYAAFLSAVGADDPNGLYNEEMGSNPRGGIVRDGAPGGFSYTIKPDMGNKPVNLVSWLDAARFVNWLHNGQPDGPQSPNTTEDGVYDLSGPDAGANAARKPGSRWSLPSEQEWYKAAYHDPTRGGAPYWLYPTRSDDVPTIATADTQGNISNPGANVVNWLSGANWGGQFVDEIGGNVTTVGSAGPLSASYYGTYDQGGNILEWTETLGSTGHRVQRGGGWGQHLVIAHPESAFRYTSDVWNLPTAEHSNIGFRVGYIPEPGTFVGAVALLVLGRRSRSHK